MSSRLSALPLRARLFAQVLQALSTPATNAEEMVAARAMRARQLQLRGAGLVFGRTAAGVVVNEVELGSQRLRLYRPAGVTAPLPVVLNIHGGGWCQGAPEQSEWLASNVAAQVGALVVSPSYRLAPEEPFPAGLDDVTAALAWVRQHASEFGGDPTRIVVMGDSAGGNLAAVTALLARDAGQSLLGQVLIYPAVELYETYPSETEHASAPVLTAEGMHTFARLYLGEQYGTTDWRANPLRVDSLQGLPPTLIVSAEIDPLRDQSRVYTAALRAAGVSVHLYEHHDAIHGFLSLPGAIPAARTALSQIVDFLRLLTRP